MNIMKNNLPLQIAFLGGAINSAVGYTHYIASSLDNRFKVVAGCFSRDVKLNEDTAQLYNISKSRTYNSLEELVYSEINKIDGLVILTPTDQHIDQVAYCISKGIPVICEKALATSSNEIISLKKTLEENSGFLKVIYNYLGYPMVRELRSLIQSGVLGNIHQVNVEMPQEGFIRKGIDGASPIPQKWRLRDGIIPTISLDLGVHLHMLIKYLTNEKPLEVVSTCISNGNFSEVIDNINCLIKYSNNIVCNMWYSKTSLGQRNGLRIRIFGNKGSAEWLQINPENLFLYDIHGDSKILDRGSAQICIANSRRYTRFKVGHPAGFIEAFANYYYDIADQLSYFQRNKKSNNSIECFGIEESLEGIILFEAISKSNTSKNWEHINL